MGQFSMGEKQVGGRRGIGEACVPFTKGCFPLESRPTQLHWVLLSSLFFVHWVAIDNLTWFQPSLKEEIRISTLLICLNPSGHNQSQNVVTSTLRNIKTMDTRIILSYFILTPKVLRPFSSFYEVWAGHCGCNVCPKNLKFLVNMWFSTSFKTHLFLQDSNLWFRSYAPKIKLFCSWAAKKTFYFLTFLSWVFFHKFLTKFLNISSIWKSSKTHWLY